MKSYSSERGKIIFGLQSVMPLRAANDDPVLTDTDRQPAPTSYLQNGVARVAGSYLFRNRVDAVIGTLDAADVQAWDLRADGIDPVADATFPEFQIAPPVAAVNYLFNGTSFDRQASAGAASLAADPVVGAMLVTEAGQWVETDAPAASVLATATRAAGAGGERHICKSIHATLAMDTTAVPGFRLIRLRDGITAVGTILWDAVVFIPASETVIISISDLAIVGSPDTAMTLEFSAFLTDARESVGLTGITVI